jgi:hypothetical protein
MDLRMIVVEYIIVASRSLIGPLSKGTPNVVGVCYVDSPLRTQLRAFSMRLQFVNLAGIHQIYCNQSTFYFVHPL